MAQQQQTLKRGLKNRHIQLIALGGAVGTGLFLGIATTIQMAAICFTWLCIMWVYCFSHYASVGRNDSSGACGRFI